MDQPLFNQYGRQIRAFLCLGLGILFLCIPPGLIYLIARPAYPGTLAMGCLLGIFIPAPIGVAMLLCALMMLPRAGYAKRALAEFAAGQCLAHWKYADDLWQARVRAERRKVRIIFTWLCIAALGMGCFISFMSTLSIYETHQQKVVGVVYILGGTFVLTFGLYFLGTMFSHRRAKRLLTCGEAYIGHHAAYCGGDFIFWGTGTQALQSARLKPGNPPTIELVVGLSSGAKKIAGAIDVVNLANLHPSYASNYSVSQSIPIPGGGEAAANAIIQQLISEIETRRAANKPAHVPVAHTAAIASATPAPHPAPAAPQTKAAPAPVEVTLEILRRRARRWWFITAGMAAAGVALFLWAVILSINSPQGASVGNTRAAIGFVLFFLSIIPLAIAVIKTFNVKRAEHRVSSFH